MITKEDFADDLSKTIFEDRKAFYETGDQRHLLRMVLHSHSDTVWKVQRIAQAFYRELDKTKIRIIIFGGG